MSERRADRETARQLREQGFSLVASEALARLPTRRLGASGRPEGPAMTLREHIQTINAEQPSGPSDPAVESRRREERVARRRRGGRPGTTLTSPLGVREEGRARLG